MRVIALMNQKGGVGKTTTTVNLGAALAEQGKRVCLVDLDPQAHLTINYGVEPTADHISLYDVLIDDRSFLEAVHTVDQNVALVPSSIDLAGAEIELVTKQGREMLLKRKIESATHDFDFMLLDCPPSLGLLTINALAVASEVIIPMQPHFLALQGVAKLLETVHLVSRRMNPQLKVAGIVLTMYDAQTKLTSEVVAELNGFIQQAEGKPLPWASAKVFNTKIRRNIKLAECPSFGQTILKYDTASNGAMDYRNLARELIGLPPLAPAAAKPQAARVAVPITKAPSPVPVAAKQVSVTPVGNAPTMPPKPVMPPALAAAVKARAMTGMKKPSAPPVVKPTASAPAPVAPVVKATASAPASTVPAPAAVIAPAVAASKPSPAPVVQAASISTPPTSAAQTTAPKPIPAPASSAPIGPKPVVAQPVAPKPAPQKPVVQVTVNPVADPAKLAAANVASARPAAPKAPAMPATKPQEVA